MNLEERARILVAQYNEGSLSPAEEQELEGLIERGLVALDALEDLHALDQRLDAFFAGERSRRMRAGFREWLASAEEDAASPAAHGPWWRRLFTPAPGLGLAHSLVVLLLGAGLGYLLRGPAAPPADDARIARLSEELHDLRESMMLTMLERESTADRLKAVNLTQEMDEVSGRVAEALLRTLNGDPNVNVRLAALDALAQYTRHPRVREGLIAAIARQQSPLVQMALAELMAGLQEKRSAAELRRLLDRDETTPEAKERIRASLEVLM